MGRRGEGTPVWSGFSSAPHCAVGGASPARSWGCILGCRETGGCEEGRRVEAAPWGSPQRRVCCIPAPPPPRPELPRACGEGSPFPPALRRSLRAGAPRPSSVGVRDPPGTASCGPCPADLGRLRGWASDPPPAPAVPPAFPEQVSGVVMKFKTSIVGRSRNWPLPRPSYPLDPYRN